MYALCFNIVVDSNCNSLVLIPYISTLCADYNNYCKLHVAYACIELDFKGNLALLYSCQESPVGWGVAACTQLRFDI